MAAHSGRWPICWVERKPAMSASGLLAQLPDLGALEHLRDTAGAGLSGPLDQLGNAERLLAPLIGALAPLSGQAPDLDGALDLLVSQRGALVAALPGDTAGQVGAVLPLLDSAQRLVSSSAVAPILDDLRAGRSINQIARDALALTTGELLGALPVLAGDAIPDEARTAISAIQSAMQGLGAAPDAGVLADTIAEYILGAAPVPLRAVANVRRALFEPLDSALALTGSEFDSLVQRLVARVDSAATLLETIDPQSVPEWQAAGAMLTRAATDLTGLRVILEPLPNRLHGVIAATEPGRYTAELRQALAALPAPDNRGRSISLEELASGILDPLDTMTAALEQLSPAQFTSALRAHLDRLLAIFDTLAESVQDNPVLQLFDDLRQAVAAIAGAIQGVRDTIDGAVQTLAGVAGGALGAFSDVRRQVEDAFRAFQAAITAIDVAGLVQAVRSILDQAGDALSAVPLPDLKAGLDQALTTVEGLVEMLAGAVAGAVEQAGALVDSLGDLSFRPLVEPVVDAIDAVQSAVAAINLDLLPDMLREQVGGVVSGFVAEFGDDPEQWFEREIIGALTAAFDAAAGAVRDLLGRLRGKLAEFAAAIDRLDPAALLAPLTDLFQRFDAALDGLSGDGLLNPVRAVLDDLRAALDAIAPERLLAPLEEAFERDVLAPIRDFRPSSLLAPLIDAFEPVEELLGKLDFSEALRGLGQEAGEFLGATQAQFAGGVDAGPVQPILDLLRPATGVEQWTGALEEQFAAYRPGRLLAPLQEALAPLESAVSAAADDVLAAVAARIGDLTPSALLHTETTATAVRERFERLAQDVELHRPAAVAAAYGAGYARLSAALARVDERAVPEAARSAFQEVRNALVTLAPASLIALDAEFAALPGRLRQSAGRTLDLSGLAAQFGDRLVALGGRIPATLRSTADPAAIRQALAGLLPGALITRVDERFESFLAAAQRFGPAIQAAVEGVADQIGEKLAALTPAALFERFDELFAPIRSTVQAMSPRALAEALDGTYTSVVEQLDQLHPRLIREPVQQLFNTTLAALDDLRTGLIETLAAAVDAALGRIRDVLRLLDPRVLVIGLGNLFALVKQSLTALNLDVLLDRLAAAFDRLRTDLLDSLARTGAAFDRMLGALLPLVGEGVP